MRRSMAGLAVAVLVVGVAWAGDPPAKDAVEVKRAAKVGDEWRFRRTERSTTERAEGLDQGKETTRNYAVVVKAVRPDGGLDTEVTFNQVLGRTFNRKTREWEEFDTTRPAAPGKQASEADLVARAMTGRPIKAILDAHGALVSTSGLRDVVRDGIKGTAIEKTFDVDRVFADAACTKLLAPLFVSTPAGLHAVRSKWTGDLTAEFLDEAVKFDVEWTLDAATADEATVGASCTLMPPANATGFPLRGSGVVTTTFSRKDGLVLKSWGSLMTDLGADATRVVSRTEWTIERLLPPTAKRPDPKATAKIETTKSTMRDIKNALMMYYMHHAGVPATLAQLCGPKNDDSRELNMEKPPKDGWGNDFVYTPNGKRKYDLVSYGADGKPGGDNDAKDITLADLN